MRYLVGRKVMFAARGKTYIGTVIGQKYITASGYTKYVDSNGKITCDCMALASPNSCDEVTISCPFGFGPTIATRTLNEVKFL